MDIAVNKQLHGNQAALKHLFRSAYFLFSGESAHTTHWRNLQTSLSLKDHNQSMSTFLKTRLAMHTVYQHIVTDIRNSFDATLSKQMTTKLADIGKFSLTADECTNINGCEMLSIMVRYLNGKEIIESFVSAVSVASTTAEVIASAIVEQQL